MSLVESLNFNSSATNLQCCCLVFSIKVAVSYPKGIEVGYTLFLLPVDRLIFCFSSTIVLPKIRTYVRASIFGSRLTFKI